MKKNPGKLSYCSSGTGSSDHLTAELLEAGDRHRRGARPVQGRRRVPDRHHGQPGRLLVPEPRRGHQLHQGQPHEGARGDGEGAPSAAARRADRPARRVRRDLVVTSWQAAAAPAKTPKEVVARLNGAMVKALRSPDVSRAHEPDRLRRGRQLARGIRRLHEGRGRALDERGRQGKHQAGMIVRKEGLTRAIEAMSPPAAARRARRSWSPRIWSPPTCSATIRTASA